MNRWVNSIRNLPRNLRTLRPYVLKGGLIPWMAGLEWVVATAPGDERYPLHFEETGIVLKLGWWYVEVGIKDTN